MAIKSRKKTLNLPSEITSMFRQGAKQVSSTLIIYHNPNGFKYNRSVVMIKKRDFKSAVVRNKLKRVIKACIDGCPQQGFDLVVVVRPRAGRESLLYAKTQKDLMCLGA